MIVRIQKYEDKYAARVGFWLFGGCIDKDKRFSYLWYKEDSVRKYCLFDTKEEAELAAKAYKSKTIKWMWI